MSASRRDTGHKRKRLGHIAAQTPYAADTRARKQTIWQHTRKSHNQQNIKLTPNSRTFNVEIVDNGMTLPKCVLPMNHRQVQSIWGRSLRFRLHIGNRARRICDLAEEKTKATQVNAHVANRTRCSEHCQNHRATRDDMIARQ